MPNFKFLERCRMKGILQRLFGSSGPSHNSAVRTEIADRLEIKPFGHGLVKIPALDFFGPHAASPNGEFHLAGQEPRGHGRWLPVRGPWNLDAADRQWRDTCHRSSRTTAGRSRRRRTGSFILSDWMFRGGLNGRLVALADGKKLVERQFSANLASSGLSSDGRFAICQTANAPGSPDSCRYFLFDLDEGPGDRELGTGNRWASSCEFEPANRRAPYLIGNDDERVGYDFDGAMIDREGWQRGRISAGDIEVMRSVIES